MKGKFLWLVICTIALLAGVAILTYFASSPTMSRPTSSNMKLSSSAFSEGGAIPREYTCDGEEKSPELSISGVPKGTESLALIVEDPDAPKGTFTHWVVFNIDGKTTTIPPEMPRTSATFGTSGTNSAGSIEYAGPCPPTGTHRYFFILYALNRKLDLPEGASKENVLAAMSGHVLAEARLMGTYAR